MSSQQLSTGAFIVWMWHPFLITFSTTLTAVIHKFLNMNFANNLQQMVHGKRGIFYAQQILAGCLDISCLTGGSLFFLHNLNCLLVWPGILWGKKAPMVKNHYSKFQSCLLFVFLMFIQKSKGKQCFQVIWKHKPLTGMIIQRMDDWIIKMFVIQTMVQ